MYFRLLVLVFTQSFTKQAEANVVGRSTKLVIVPSSSLSMKRIQIGTDVVSHQSVLGVTLLCLKR